MSESPTDYLSAIADTRIGKRVGLSLYIHREAVDLVPTHLRTISETALSTADARGFQFNVLKFGTESPTLSLLNYPDLFEQGFPTLEASAVCDLESWQLTIRRYDNKETRPVLHRKELLLRPDDKRITKYAALTEASEQSGLFTDIACIGSQGVWMRSLKDKGLRVTGHKLLRHDGRPVEPGKEEIWRYRTALSRNRLSLPVQYAFKLGLLAETSTFFDYGCGKGDDIQLLQGMGNHRQRMGPAFLPK